METRPLSVFLFVFYFAPGLFPLPRVSSGDVAVNGTRGASVLWPCRHTLSEPFQPDTSSIFWQGYKKYDIVLHVYKDGQEEFHYQNKSFNRRTSIFPDQLPAGNFSLLIERLMLEDDQISVKVFFMAGFKQAEKLCEATLHVAACFQEPQIQVNEAETTASCSTKGGYPLPEVTWTSKDGGRTLKAGEFSTRRDGDGTYSVVSTANITGMKSVTCEVFNPTSGQTVRTSWEKAPSPSGHPVAIIIISITIFIIIVIIFVVMVVKRWTPSCQSPRAVAAQRTQSPGEASGGREAPHAAPGGNRAAYRRPNSVTSDSTATNHD